MRTYPQPCIARHAFRVQAIAFGIGIVASMIFIGFALMWRDSLAVASALLGCFAYGIAAGAWIVAERFNP